MAQYCKFPIYSGFIHDMHTYAVVDIVTVFNSHISLAQSCSESLPCTSPVTVAAASWCKPSVHPAQSCTHKQLDMGRKFIDHCHCCNLYMVSRLKKPYVNY